MFEQIYVNMSSIRSMPIESCIGRTDPALLFIELSQENNNKFHTRMI